MDITTLMIREQLKQWTKRGDKKKAERRVRLPEKVWTKCLELKEYVEK